MQTKSREVYSNLKYTFKMHYLQFGPVIGLDIHVLQLDLLLPEVIDR